MKNAKAVTNPTALLAPCGIESAPKVSEFFASHPVSTPLKSEAKTKQIRKHKGPCRHPKWQLKAFQDIPRQMAHIDVHKWFWCQRSSKPPGTPFASRETSKTWNMNWKMILFVTLLQEFVSDFVVIRIIPPAASEATAHPHYMRWVHLQVHQAT